MPDFFSIKTPVIVGHPHLGSAHRRGNGQTGLTDSGNPDPGQVIPYRAIKVVVITAGQDFDRVRPDTAPLHQGQARIGATNITNQ